MSTSKKTTEVELLPFQQENVATNQQQIALSYVGGERLMALRWMTQAIDERTHQVPSSGKKG